MGHPTDDYTAKEYAEFVELHCSAFVKKRFRKNPEDKWVRRDVERIWDEQNRLTQQDFWEQPF